MHNTYYVAPVTFYIFPFPNYIHTTSKLANLLYTAKHILLKLDTTHELVYLLKHDKASPKKVLDTMANLAELPAARERLIDEGAIEAAMETVEFSGND